MSATTMQMSSISYEFNQRFAVPAREAFDWSTDYRTDDLALMGEKGKRRIKRITEDTIILEERVTQEDRRIRKVKLVKLNARTLSWHNIQSEQLLVSRRTITRERKTVKDVTEIFQPQPEQPAWKANKDRRDFTRTERGHQITTMCPDALESDIRGHLAVLRDPETPPIPTHIENENVCLARLPYFTLKREFESSNYLFIIHS